MKLSDCNPQLRSRIEHQIQADEQDEKAFRKPPMSKGIGTYELAVAHQNSKRIRQRTKPLLNKLETEYFNVLFCRSQDTKIHCQAIRFQLANGMAYTPDLFAFDWPNPDESPGSPVTWPFAWEIKGPHAFDGALEKLKIAARAYPEITWMLAWKKDGQWLEQTVLP